jgi:hypothetical protein
MRKFYAMTLSSAAWKAAMELLVFELADEKSFRKVEIATNIIVTNEIRAINQVAARRHKSRARL